MNRKTFALLAATLLMGLPACAAPPPGASGTQYKPGTVARDRLRGLAVLFEAPDAVVLDAPGRSGPPLPAAQARAAVRQIPSIFLDDALYAGQVPNAQGQPDFAFRVTRGTLTATVSVWLESRRVRMYGLTPSENFVEADYTPVAGKLTRLLETLAPNNPTVQKVHGNLPAAIPSEIPLAVRRMIATIKPGMTRADVMRLFATEGGLSTTYWNHYVYCGADAPPNQSLMGAPAFGSGSDKNKLVKINVNYAPRGAQILWINGRGVLVHQSDWAHFSGRERPDDIILAVSPPYLEWFIPN